MRRHMWISAPPTRTQPSRGRICECFRHYMHGVRPDNVEEHHCLSMACKFRLSRASNCIGNDIVHKSHMLSKPCPIDLGTVRG